MIGRLYEVVIDCPDPVKLAEFYRELTGLDQLHAAGEDWVTLGRGADVRLAFQRVTEHRPPQWPDPARSQQMHLDLFVDDLDVAQERVLALGARLLSAGESASYRIFADPAGHPFCLCLDDPEAP